MEVKELKELEEKAAAITPEHIKGVYEDVDDDRRLAVSRIIMEKIFILATQIHNPKGDPDYVYAAVDMFAERDEAHNLICSIVNLGIKAFGHSWKRDLIKHLRELPERV